MTRFEGLIMMFTFAVLAVLCGNAADATGTPDIWGWLNWGTWVFLSVGCLAYCLYYMHRFFNSLARK